MWFYLCVCCFLINQSLAVNITTTADKCPDNVLLLNILLKIKDDINSVTSKLGIAETTKCLSTKDNNQQQPTLTTADIKARRNELDYQRVQQVINFIEASNVPHDADLDDKNGFEVAANWIGNLSDSFVIDYSVRYLQSKVHFYNSDKLSKWICLVKILEKRILNKTNEEYSMKQLAQLTANELRDSIRAFAVEAFNASVAIGEFESNGEMQNLTTALYLFDPQQWETIIEEFVNTNYDQESFKNILKIITSHKFVQQRARGLGVFFKKVENSGDLNSNFTLKIASELHKLRSDSEFENLNKTQKDEVEKLIEKLPACARNLFFLPYVCFFNKDRKEYLTSAQTCYNYFLDRRYVLSEALSSRSEWYVKTSGDDIFLFASRFFDNEYLYAAYDYGSDLRYVFNWLPGGADKQSEWNIVLEGDHCYVKSVYFKEFMFASNIKTRGHDVPLVLTWKDHASVSESKFQWEIRKCD